MSRFHTDFGRSFVFIELAVCDQTDQTAAASLKKIVMQFAKFHVFFFGDKERKEIAFLSNYVVKDSNCEFMVKRKRQRRIIM